MGLSSLQLEAFLAVAKTLSFTKAAETLHITQSALSQRVLNLESELETTLFIRDRAGLKLTEAAQEVVRYCQFKDQYENELTSNFKSKDKKKIAGVLRIGGFSSVVRSTLLPAISDLLLQNQSLRLEMMVREMYQLIDLLKRTEIDYMIWNQNIERVDVESLFLGYEENVLVQKKNYSGKDIYLDHDEKDEVTYNYLKRFDKKLKKYQTHYLDDIYNIIDAVKLGLGRAILPVHLIENDKNLEILRPEHVLQTPVYLCFYKQPYYTKLHESVVSSIGQYYRKSLSQKD